ncbi:MAG: hypothetical protein H5T97_01715 [Firmicutes bacterium]|nr:hypothetical protein [Bacillota bacterium]
MAIPVLKRFTCPRCGYFFEALCGPVRYGAELRCPACRSPVPRQAGVRGPDAGARAARRGTPPAGPRRLAL